MASISEIKANTSVLDYARNILGLNVRVSGDRTYSLARGHNPTCLVVYDDWFYDFKTGQGGDLIDLCAIARHDGDRGKAIYELGAVHTNGKRLPKTFVTLSRHGMKI